MPFTPAITLPQIRQGIAMILHEAFQCGTMSHRLTECQKRLQRNELARFYDSPYKIVQVVKFSFSLAVR
jgi:hypothetical protein